MDEPIPISALQHWSYCPRQCALIHIEQVFANNVHTARGNTVHSLVDVPAEERQGTTRIERALPLWSERLGLVGKADLVEFSADGTPYPVEYKHGPKRKREHDDLQLAAQAMCLEEMTGKQVLTGAIFHFTSRRRREVKIGAQLRNAVEAAAQEVGALLQGTDLPDPVNDARCRQCSLLDLCQPAAIKEHDRYHQLLRDLYGD